MTTKCIRFENSKGIGIFRGFDSTEWVYRKMVERHCADFKAPYYDPLVTSSFPSFDSNLNVYALDRQWFCAFKSVEELHKWIEDDELAYLYDNGFKCYVVECTEYQIGLQQVIYTKESIVSQTELFTF